MLYHSLQFSSILFYSLLPFLQSKFNTFHLYYFFLHCQTLLFLSVHFLYRSDSRTPRNSTVKDTRLTGSKRPASRSPPRAAKNNQQAVNTSVIRRVDYGEMTASYLSESFNAPAINRLVFFIVGERIEGDERRGEEREREGMRGERREGEGRREEGRRRKERGGKEVRG